MNLTQIVGKFFVPRQHALERYQNEGEVLQRAVLCHLLNKAKDTEYGRNHDFQGIGGYDDFIAHVPVNTYEDMYEGTEEDDRDAQYYDDLNGEIIDQIEEYIENDEDESAF